jgi:hypothetical protein
MTPNGRADGYRIIVRHRRRSLHQFGYARKGERMSQRMFWILLAAVLAGLLATLASAQNSTQARASGGNAIGRYQLVDGPVTKVFDTYTGKSYVWFPRDEKEKTDPYLFVQDPVNATGTTVAIRWEMRPAGK